MQNIFVIGGGATGSAIKAVVMVSILPTWETILSVVICGAIGAIVGFFVNKFLNYCFKKKNK